jgi:hypothetical protein
MADGGWRMKIAAKVPVLEAEVGGDEDLVSGGRTKDGAVISDTERHCLVASSVCRGKGSANLFDQRKFSEGFGYGTGHLERVM